MKLFIAIFLCVSQLIFSNIITGKVLYVSDGDTLTMEHLGEKVRVRFYGIDAPEKAQDYGLEAKEFVKNRLDGEEIEVDIESTDRYGRKIGKIYYDGGKYLNLEVVEEGYAWWYEYYAKKEYDLRDAMNEAKKKKKGLWKKSNPVNPYDYRKNN